MISKEKLTKIRDLIVKMAAKTEDAYEYPELFQRWSEDGHDYETGDLVSYGEYVYRVLQDHTSQTTWTPTDAPSLFARVLIPDPEIIPDWVQPESTNPYMKGDKVRYKEKVWVSIIDNNVWSPDVYGWEEVV